MHYCNQSLHRLWSYKVFCCSTFPLIDGSDYIRWKYNIYLHTLLWILHLKFWDAEEKAYKIALFWLQGFLFLYYCKAKSRSLWLEHPIINEWINPSFHYCHGFKMDDDFDMSTASSFNYHIAHRSQEEGQGAIDTIPELRESQLHCRHIGYVQTLQTHNLTNLFGTWTAKCEVK